MKMRVAIRGSIGSVLLFEDRVEMDSDDLDQLLPSLAEKHGRALAAHDLHMIEIEFLDEPDPNQRFFRFGTDPAGMGLPMRVNLRNDEAGSSRNRP